MKINLVFLVTGALLGAALVYFSGARSSDAPSAVRSPAPEIYAAPQTGELARLKEEITTLKAQLESAGHADPAADSSATAKAEEKDENARAIKIDMEKMQKHWEEQERKRSEKRIAAKLAGLKRRLGLRPEQEEQILALLAEQEEAQRSRLGSVFSLIGKNGDEIDDEAGLELVDDLLGGDGNATPEDDFDTRLAAILDDGQKAAYEKYLQDRRNNEIESRANSELAALQNIVDLTPEQKDRAFDAFAKLAGDDAGAGGVESGRFDLARLQRQQEQRSNALRAILTPDQFELYRTTDQGTVFTDAVGGVSGGVRVMSVNFNADGSPLDADAGPRIIQTEAIRIETDAE